LEEPGHPFATYKDLFEED
jgi:hypothetical protein